MPLQQLEARRRLWLAAEGGRRRAIRAAWMAFARRRAKWARDIWCRVRGPMSAAAALLDELGWLPLFPDRCLRPSGQEYAATDGDDRR